MQVQCDGIKTLTHGNGSCEPDRSDRSVQNSTVTIRPHALYHNSLPHLLSAIYIYCMYNLLCTPCTGIRRTNVARKAGSGEQSHPKYPCFRRLQYEHDLCSGRASWDNAVIERPKDGTCFMAKPPAVGLEITASLLLTSCSLPPGRRRLACSCLFLWRRIGDEDPAVGRT